MRATRRRLGLAVVAALLLVGSRGARAQGSAEEAFERGRDAMLRGDYAVACPLLAESYRRDARLGVLFTLAECESRGGKAARAVAHYDAFLRAYARSDAPRGAANEERQRIAVSRRAVLAPRVAFVTLVTSAEARPVSIDGETIAPDALGAELALDPGVATIVVGPPGAHPPIVLTLTAGEHRTVVLTPVAAPPAALIATAPPRAPDIVVAAPPPPPRTRRSPWPYVAGTVGLAGAGVGVVTGAMVIAKKGPIDSHCPDHRCDAQGLDDVDAAHGLGRVSTIGFIAGGAGLATAAILLLTSPARPTAWAPTPRPALAVAPAGLGAVVSGTW